MLLDFRFSRRVTSIKQEVNVSYSRLRSAAEEQKPTCNAFKKTRSGESEDNQLNKFTERGKGKESFDLDVGSKENFIAVFFFWWGAEVGTGV